MLTDNAIEYIGGNDTAFGAKGIPLVWIIDGECLYDLAVFEEYSDMFLSSDEVIDISSEYEDHDGIVVSFIKNNEILNKLKTTEYFGNILLSSPQVLNLLHYPYGRYVQSPNAQFDGEKFIITNRDVSQYPAWHPRNPHTPEGYFEEFNK